MIICYLSDLHFEFHRDGGHAFVDALPTDCDVLLLAGDIGVAYGGLERHVHARMIVVTHHLPDAATVAPRFRGRPLNPFFVHPEAAGVLRSARPVAWIHGHSHEVARERVDETLLLRNPFGYAPNDLVADFSPTAQLAI